MSEILEKHGLEKYFTKRDEPIVILDGDVQNTRISLEDGMREINHMFNESERLSLNIILD